MGETCCEPDVVPTSKTILVVEDEVLIRLAAAEGLMDSGFHVIQAATADEALKVLQSPVEIDLVITDIRMPGSVDGLALAGLIREQWPDIKIIIVSGHLLSIPPGDPADVFVTKPYLPTAIAESARRLLGVEHDKS